MKAKEALQSIIEQIAKADSPVGMDALYVHALILDQLAELSTRLDKIEQQLAAK